MDAMNLETAKSLDNALRLLCQGCTNVNGEDWFTAEISARLIADGYIISKNKRNDFDIIDVEVTDRGHVFYSQGGYLKQVKDENYEEYEREAREQDRTDQKWNRWLSFGAILVSAICALVQLIHSCKS